MEQTELPNISFNTHVGPTRFSNWVLPGKLITGAYPDHKTEVLALVNAGVNKFVSMESFLQNAVGQKSFKIKSYENEVRLVEKETKKKIQYSAFDQEEMNNLSQGCVLRSPNKLCSHDRFDLTHKLSARPLLTFIYTEILQSLYEGNCLYVHDIGGHGISGMVCAIVIGVMYQIPSSKALNYISKAHENRKDAPTLGSPENLAQRLQVMHCVDILAEEMEFTFKSEEEPVVVAQESSPLRKKKPVAIKTKSTPTKKKNISSPKKKGSVQRTPSTPKGKQSKRTLKEKKTPKTPQKRSDRLLTNVSESPTTPQGPSTPTQAEIEKILPSHVTDFEEMNAYDKQVGNYQTPKNKTISTILNLPHENSEPLDPSDMPPAPTSQSNYLIDDRVIVGAYPFDMSTVKQVGDNWRKNLVLQAGHPACTDAISLLKEGVTTFVCLQSEIPIAPRKSTEDFEFKTFPGRNSTRYGGYFDYFETIEELVEIHCPERKMHYVVFPMVDRAACSIIHLESLIKDLINRIHQNEKIYVHSGEGHGRVGIVGSALLSAVHSIDPTEAMKLNSNLHNTRSDTKGIYHSPYLHPQKMTVIDFHAHYNKVQSSRITSTSRFSQSTRNGSQNRVFQNSSSIFLG